jgi:hypothetical protein
MQRYLLVPTSRFAVLGALMFLASCDVDLFRSDAKRLAGPYQLSLTDGPDHCAIKLKHDFITPNLESVGWQKPIIIGRAADTAVWHVIETDTGRQFQIPDSERRTNARYASIEVHPAIEAWKSLGYHKRLW